VEGALPTGNAKHVRKTKKRAMQRFFHQLKTKEYIPFTDVLSASLIPRTGETLLSNVAAVTPEAVLVKSNSLLLELLVSV
jgi:hypothetical protein